MPHNCFQIVVLQVSLAKQGVFKVLDSRFDVPKDDAVCPLCQENMGMKISVADMSNDDQERYQKAKDAKDGHTLLDLEFKYKREDDGHKTDNLSCSCAKIPAVLQSCGHHVHVGCYITSIQNDHPACPTCTVVPEKLRT